MLSCFKEQFLIMKNKFKVNFVVNVNWFLKSILVAILLAIFIYIGNKQLHLGIDNTMTGYIGLIAALPTAYLWIVRERKKEAEIEYRERELLNKYEEMYQNKVIELTKFYLESVNLFFSDETSKAGAYALNGLIIDWINLSRLYSDHLEECTAKISQTASVLFSKPQSMDSKIVTELLLNLLRYNKNSSRGIAWYESKFENITIGLYANESHPGHHIFRNVFNNQYIEGIKFENSAFSELEMMKIHANYSQFIKCDFRATNLQDSILVEANFNNSMMVGTNLSFCIASDATFDNVDLTNADFSHSNLIGASFKNSNLTGVDFSGAVIKKTDFTGACLKNAKFEGASIENSYFNDSDITGIDLKGDELDGSQIYNLRFYGTEPTDDIKEKILNGKLQDIFKLYKSKQNFETETLPF